MTGISNEYKFTCALPVWEENKLDEMNCSILLRGIVNKGEAAVLRITAQSRYQVYVNGFFVSAGPARAAHGFYRVSEYDLSGHLTESENVVAIIAAGYNVNSFYLTEDKPFVCAELEVNSEIRYATGTDREFEAVCYHNRIQKVQRFSFQRPFTESYIFDSYYDAFFTHPEEKFRNIKLVKTQDKCFIERNVPYCEYKQIKAKTVVSKGILIPNKDAVKWDDRSLIEIDDKLKGFKEKELESCVVNELYSYKTQVMEPESFPMEPVKLGINCCAVYDMGLNTTGLIRLSLTAEHDTVIYAVFNEILPEEGVPDAGRNGCANVVRYALQGGRAYDLVSFEPYTYRYIQIVSMYAPCLITNVSQLREVYNEKLLTNLRKMPDGELQEIYDAAVESFVQNSTDIFMDCPSRERAGWLCDSFFTSKVEKELTGNSIVEHNFLENFLLPESFNYIPDGMLPMCYPADHNDTVYIHNWAMWYVIELKEYLERSSDRELIEKAKDRVYKLLRFTEKYENADGLLEKLESWVFVEWSEANDFVQDINYPTNMLYSLFLDSIAELYSDNSLREKAEKLRQTIREKSFDGEFFCDNAVLDENGVAVRTNNRTETCQYYAFFTKTATKESFPELYEKMINDFGPNRKDCNRYPDIPFSNAFIGNYLRLIILLENGENEKLQQEIRDFFLTMAKTTGTLWENMTDYASCCHGFASFVAYVLNKIV